MRRNEFTLMADCTDCVELLVVIGILAILAALIYPTFGTTRAAARTSACLSNLRQISFAVQMYVNDNAGRLPALQNRTNTVETVPSLDTTLLPEMEGQVAVFECPADNAQLFQTTGTSYFWNFTVNGQDVNNLSSIVGGSESTGVPLVSDKQGFHPDIKNRVNILYADGHVAKQIQFSTSLP